jgi:hypothetical protein
MLEGELPIRVHGITQCAAAGEERHASNLKQSFCQLFELKVLLTAGQIVARKINEKGNI